MAKNTRLIGVLIFVMTILVGPLPGTAQETAMPPVEVQLPDPLTPDTINALVSRLSDQQVRELLLDQLGTVAAQRAVLADPVQPEDLPAFFTDTTRKTLYFFGQTIIDIPTAFATEARAITTYLNELGLRGLLMFFSIFALASLLGMAAEALLYRYLMTGRVPSDRNTRSFGVYEALPILAKRLVRELSGTVVFFVVADLAVDILMPARDVEVAHIFVRCLIILPRIAAAFLSFFFSPRRTGLGLLPIEDHTATFLFRNLLGVSVMVGLALALLQFNNHVGAPRIANGLAFWLNLLIFGWLAYIFVRARLGFSLIILGHRQKHTDFELRVARYYPWFAVVVILGTWFLSVVIGAMGKDALLKDGRHIISLAVLIIAPLLDTVIQALVQHFSPPMRGEGRVAQKAYDASLSAYTRMSRVFVFGIVLLVTASLWDVTPMSMASAGVGEQIAAHLIQALLICVAGYIVWELTRLFINRRLAAEMTVEVDPSASESDDLHFATGPSSRMGTILPPVSWALQAAIITLTVLTALGNLGIDVTPLLAGAGIAGIAIGFGAQKLVSDVMSGLFFLIDDAFRLNEYIDTGGTQGTVERISLRSLQLRDAKGPVLCIPYSSIKTVTNFGRDWGIMKLKFTVPFDTDLERVRKIFKKIGQEMMEDPLLAPGFIEPFKSQGVGEFNEYGIVVRGKFMHKPGAQFGIRKQVFKRVQEEFAGNGIQFARREVRVSVSGNGSGSLTDEQVHQAGAAAYETIAADERATANARAKAASA